MIFIGRYKPYYLANFVPESTPNKRRKERLLYRCAVVFFMV